MKVLVFGFSVTEDAPGYVEFWKKRHSAVHPDLEIEKVGMGGLLPPNGRHIIPSMIRQHKPDMVVFEIATPAYRLRPNTPETLAEHFDTVNFLVRLCDENGIRCGFLDLPIQGLDLSRDWLCDIHHDLLPAYGVPEVFVGLQPELLRDIVHPNDQGRVVYADAMEELITKMLASTRDRYRLAKSATRFDAFALEDLERDGGELVEYKRNGFRAGMLELPAGQRLTATLPGPAEVIGVMFTMGPKTGNIRIEMGDNSQVIGCYDEFCYYLRAGVRGIKPVTCTEISFTQDPKVPDVVLKKGTKDLGERVGGITHLLYRREWPSAS